MRWLLQAVKRQAVNSWGLDSGTVLDCTPQITQLGMQKVQNQQWGSTKRPRMEFASQTQVESTNLGELGMLAPLLDHAYTIAQGVCVRGGPFRNF